ncbi:MAG: hypothetical protein U5K00_21785 [Melioribacteraceae bacterium]|nr:hypothetical protein [Melioribacteraceae bacterium]
MANWRIGELADWRIDGLSNLRIKEFLITIGNGIVSITNNPLTH